MRLSPVKARHREPAAPWSGLGLPSTCSSHDSLPQHTQGSNVTTNNLDFNQEIAHPFSAPLTGLLKRKTRKVRLCTGLTEQASLTACLCSSTPHHHIMGQTGFPPDAQGFREHPWQGPCPIAPNTQTIYEPRELKYLISLTRLAESCLASCSHLIHASSAKPSKATVQLAPQKTC